MSELLSIEGLTVGYGGSAAGPVVKGFTLSLGQGELHALVGESGSGKSSVLRALLGLAPILGGRLLWRGQEVNPSQRGPGILAYRRQVQMIFQDPYNSLHPRLTIGQNLLEPLRIHGLFEPSSSARKATELLLKVGLDADHLQRYPNELSGGQLQRVGIARALILEPSLVLADEPVSALDVSVQAQIINLLAELSEETGIALLMVSHDLAVVHQLCHEVHVLYRGELVESGPCQQVCFHPEHPYTQELVAASS